MPKRLVKGGEKYRADKERVCGERLEFYVDCVGVAMRGGERKLRALHPFVPNG